MKYFINIIDKVGFSCFDIVDVLEVVDIGNQFNIVTGMGDMWIEKDYCNISYTSTGSVDTIQYNTDYINVFIEKAA